MRHIALLKFALLKFWLISRKITTPPITKSRFERKSTKQNIYCSSTWCGVDIYHGGDLCVGASRRNCPGNTNAAYRFDWLVYVRENRWKTGPDDSLNEKFAPDTINQPPSPYWSPKAPKPPGLVCLTRTPRMLKTRVIFFVRLLKGEMSRVISILNRVPTNICMLRFKLNFIHVQLNGWIN